MSRWEQTGNRDMGFSRWHRSFMPDNHAIIDNDWTGFCPDCHQPIYLLELALDSGQSHKTATVTKNLAKLAGLPAYVVLYRNNSEGVAEHFRYQELYPCTQSGFTPVTPEELLGIWRCDRQIHAGQCDRSLVRFG